MEQPAIVIIEDHDAVRSALAGLVRIAFPGYAVLETEDGVSGLAAALAHPAVLAIVDVSLPDTDGLQLVARLCRERPALRVLVISQHPASIYAPRALAAGACEFIPKERLHEDLVPAIARALEPRPDHGA
jgi:DNA-binding NarL/FixJ family response regulator